MVDSRQKGSRGEAEAAKLLKSLTGLDFKRVPMSGALHESHQLKGDLYLVNSLNIYCIEVKFYEDDHLTSKILTGKTPQIIEWLQQTNREAAQISRKPLLLFKFNRSKWFCAFKDMPSTDQYRWMFMNIDGYEFYVSLLEDWIKNENPRFK